MTTHGRQFIIPAREPAEELKARLMRTFPLVDEQEVARRRQFYDTFDWRLYRKGLTLEEEHSEHGRRLVMRDLGSGAVQRWVDGIEMPRYAAELPRGPFRTRLEAIASVRALLPVAELHSHFHNLRLRDDEDKTVARVGIEAAAVSGNAQPQQLARRLMVLAVRGHPSPAERVSRFATEQLHLPTARNSLLDDALAASGRRAGSYTNRPEVEIHAEEPAQDAVCRILLRLLETLEVNLPGTREYVDTEFLHDLRVAVRRTRSMIEQLKEVFVPDEIAPYRNEFRWLGSITGPCRDLDVYLLAFDSYREALPVERRAALAPMQQFLQRRHVEEQRKLVAWLDSTRLRSLLVNWREFLAHPDDDARLAPDANRPLHEVADEHIWRAYRKLRDRGRAIRKKTPAAKVHRLRIHGKKLRYLVEFFRPIYPRKKTSRFLSALKDLQHNLGDFHDFHVQSVALQRFARQMKLEGIAPPATLEASAMLAEQLSERQQRARAEFADIFADFDRARNRRIAASLFKPSRRRK